MHFYSYRALFYLFAFTVASVFLATWLMTGDGRETNLSENKRSPDALAVGLRCALTNVKVSAKKGELTAEKRNNVGPPFSFEFSKRIVPL